MAIAPTIKWYLEHRHLAHTVHELRPFSTPQEAAEILNVSPTVMVQAIPLADRLGMVLAVIGCDREIDLDKLGRRLGRPLATAEPAVVKRYVRDCDLSLLPPIAEAYGLRAIVDDSLAGHDVVYFMAGDNVTVIEIKSVFLFQSQQNVWLCSDFTRPAAKRHGADNTDAKPDKVDAFAILAELEKVDRLPPMPKLAAEIVALSASHAAGAKELGAVVQKDPSLTAQVMRYAKSPLFGYRGELHSIQDAVSRVLGYDMVMHLALGLATAKPFKIQRTGPLGLESHWRHAVYSASLAQSLCADIKTGQRPQPGIAYLVGLLHNFGHLIMGTMFKREFAQINAMAAADSTARITTLETDLLGMDHGAIGGHVFARWGLPEEVIAVTGEHHNEIYDGPHAHYVHLIRLVDHILKNHGMGDAVTGEIPPALMERFGLSELQILMTMNRVLQGCEGLNLMAQQVAA